MAWIGRVGAFTCVVGLAWTVAPQVASACSCFGASSLVAPVADEHPVGAPLVFASECGGDLESWSVTVDGAPATLVRGEGWDRVHLAGIEPAPASGAEVVLQLACSDEWQDPACSGGTASMVEKARFVIGAADTQPPPAPTALLLDSEDGEFVIGCDEDTVDLRLAATVEVVAREPGSWVVVRYEADGEELQVDGREIPADGIIETSHYTNESDLRGQEVCITAEVRDASGNARETASDCVQISAGCGCSSDGAPAAASLVLLGLALARRRRA